ncbi:MAG: hypothetical protein ACJ764_11935 [Solirubrobacteraceae bacterium]
MSNERLMGFARAATRSAPVLIFGLMAAAALAYTVHWHQTNTRRHGKAPFDLVARPASKTVTAGSVARYRISIHRGRYRGRIKLTVVKSHQSHRTNYSHLRRIGLKVKGQRATLSVRTTALDRPGRYVVQVQAVGGRYHGLLILQLKIKARKPASFKISGNFGQLWPGTSRAVNLILTNPNGQGISVKRLVLTVKSIRAPRATGALPCSAADFSVRQFTGIYPLKLPAHATRRLSDLRIAAAKQPQVTMLNRPVNQNGCQGATITLTYSGTATSP